MKHVAVAAIVLACSLASAGCVSGQYARYDRERFGGTDTLDLMTKEDVIALAKAKVSDDVIISQMNASGSYFHLSTQDIVDLANAGVSDKVIDAMIKSEPSEYAEGSGGYNYYPPYDWYAGYPYYYYPWYPSFYLGFTFPYHRAFYGHRAFSPRFNSFGHGGFYGSHGFGRMRTGGRHR
jgi:hypothetical protein